MPDAALAVMAKAPAEGHTKSRLSPPLRPRRAAALYEAMLLDTLARASRLEDVQLVLAISPPAAADYFQSIRPPHSVLLPVAGANIGVCLERVLGQLLNQGYGKALALNSDGPTLPLSYLRQALDALDDPKNDVVMGPSIDGGYYLIGMREPHPRLFEGITWSTEHVTAHTLAKAEEMELEVVKLPSWYDVDTSADVSQLQAELEALPASALPHTRRWFADLQKAGGGPDSWRSVR